MNVKDSRLHPGNLMRSVRDQHLLLGAELVGQFVDESISWIQRLGARHFDHVMQINVLVVSERIGHFVTLTILTTKLNV